MFNWIIDFSLRQRLMVLTLAVLLLTFGALNLKKLPVDALPDLNKPVVVIMTEAGGMAPADVEQLLSFPIETSVAGLPGVTRVRSVSGLGLSVVYVEFDWGADIYRIRQQVAERLNIIRDQLPPSITPQIGPINSIMGEIMLIALKSRTGQVSPMKLREIADWDMRPRLLTISGVSQVIPIGGEVKQYQISPDTIKLQQLGITLDQLETAVRGFSANSGGGFLEEGPDEYVVRNIGRTQRLEDLQNTVVGYHNEAPVLLGQVAEVSFAPKVKRGDASAEAAPAVILAVQKQPGADTLLLTREIEASLAKMSAAIPADISVEILFRQAAFIERSLDNLRDTMIHAAVIVALVLLLFLLNLRITLISLIAIPVSVLITALVFRQLGYTINSMTLGGIAIAIGELVDDAVVGVENVFRRLKQNAQEQGGKPALQVVMAATLEVRSGIYYATVIIVLVFVPLFALSGIEGRFFAPLGIAYIISILASMLVSITLTPVLSYYLLPKTKQLLHGDSWLLVKLKQWDTRVLQWSFDHGKLLFAGAVVAVVIAAASVPFFPRAFLPPFNEGTLTINVLANPGTSLSMSNRIGTLAEKLLLEVPEVTKVGRRTGRAELDEHAEGVHYSEIDVDLKDLERSKEEVIKDIRSRLEVLPATLNIGQPISHRLDHLLSGVRAQISLKIFGDDLDTLQTLAFDLYGRLKQTPGLVDVQVERQVTAHELQIRVDYTKARQYGITAESIVSALETLSNGKVVSQVIDGNRRFDVVIRLRESGRTRESLGNLLLKTPTGYIPLHFVAQLSEQRSPIQIGHEKGHRRIVISANNAGVDLSKTIENVRKEMARTKLPQGYYFDLEGQYKAQEEATSLIAQLGTISVVLILVILYSRYRSLRLALIILGNIPLALVGSVAALALSGSPLSIASMIGFITLTGISARNGILKISHYINLMAHEGEVFGRQLVIRGSLERLAPVLMTAMIAAFALLPLMLSGDQPGKEILHPVAVVIFGGLISSTVLDTLLTPVMFYAWGEEPVRRLLEQAKEEAEF